MLEPIDPKLVQVLGASVRSKQCPGSSYRTVGLPFYMVNFPENC